MLIIRTRSQTLVLGRKTALLMLVMVMLWTAMPACACPAGMGQAGQPDCCRAMTQNCPMPDAGLNASCCPAPSQDFAVTPNIVYSPEHVQKVCLAAQDAVLILSAQSGFVDLSAIKTPPPKLLSGGSSILRI